MTKDFYTERLSLMFALLSAAVIFVSSLLVKKGASFVFVSSLVVFCVILILGYAIFTIVMQALSKQETQNYKEKITVFYEEKYEYTPKTRATDAIEKPKHKGAKTKRDPLKELLAVLPPLEIKEKIKEDEKSKQAKNIETLLQEAGLEMLSDEHPLKDKMNFLIQANPEQLAHLIKGEWLTHA